VSKSASAGSSRSARCQVSLPESQTAGNSSSSPESWPPSYPRNPAEQSVAAQKMLTQNTSRVN